MSLNNAYSKCDIPSLSAGYNRCNIGDTMTKINMWLKLYNQAKAKGLIRYTMSKKLYLKLKKLKKEGL